MNRIVQEARRRQAGDEKRKELCSQKIWRKSKQREDGRRNMAILEGAFSSA